MEINYAIRWIVIYLVDRARYPTFELPGPDDIKNSPCMLRNMMLMSDCFPVFLLQFLLPYKNVDVKRSTFQ